MPNIGQIVIKNDSRGIVRRIRGNIVTIDLIDVRGEQIMLRQVNGSYHKAVAITQNISEWRIETEHQMGLF